MKNSFKIVILTILFVLFFGSIGMDIIVVQTMSDTYTKKYVTGYILDDILLDDNLEDLDEICNLVENSRNIDKITYKFLRTLSFNIVNDCYKNLRIDKYLKDVIENDLSDISESKKVYLIRNFSTKSFQDNCDQITDSLNNGWDSTKIIVILYAIFSSFVFRIITLALILFILHNIIKGQCRTSKKICDCGISLFSTSMIFGLVSLMIKLLERKITDIALGGGSGIRIHDFGILVIFLFIIGIILIISSRLIMNRENSKEINKITEK